ncbi:Phosphatidylinositol 4-kinase pik1alpha (PI4-kinase)(PtdIns-4-kinase), partial [Spiromyces aspiralis]
MAAVSPLPKDGVNPSHQQNAGEKMPDKPTTATAAPADTAITTRATSSYLLLRLFTSGFFNSWLAVSYLFRYPHSVGIQHYLCNELRKFPIEEVEFFLPQLVHLLLTRPNESIALESLLLDLSIRSSHIAILFYWHLNAYFHDMKGNPRTASFKLCQRTINQLQLILFVDDAPDLLCDSPAPVRNAFMRFAQSTRSRLNNLASTALDWRRAVSFQLAPRVRENAVATLVGMSGVLAGFGSPAIGQCMGALAIAQSRRGKISDAASTADPDICIGGAQRSLDGGDTWHRPSEDSAEDDTPDSSEILEREGGPLKQRPSFPSRQSRASPKDSLLYIESDSEVSSRSHRLGSATTKGGGVRTSSKVSRTLKSAPSDPTPDAASACRDYDKLYLGK